MAILTTQPSFPRFRRPLSSRTGQGSARSALCMPPCASRAPRPPRIPPRTPSSTPLACGRRAAAGSCCAAPRPCARASRTPGPPSRGPPCREAPRRIPGRRGVWGRPTTRAGRRRPRVTSPGSLPACCRRRCARGSSRRMRRRRQRSGPAGIPRRPSSPKRRGRTS